jgi:hypothetical protein
MRGTILILGGSLLVLGLPARAQEKDPHAGHAMAEAPSSAAPAPAAPRDEKLPPAEEQAKEALNKSPRHGELVDVKLAGGPALKTWIVYPERKDKAGVVIVITASA